MTKPQQILEKMLENDAFSRWLGLIVDDITEGACRLHYTVKADIYAPCALGATVNDATIPTMHFEIIAGAANNQLADEVKHGQMLREKGIIYGAIVGFLIGLYLYYFQPWIAETTQVHVAIIVAIATIVGALASAIGATVFGVNMFNTDLNQYKSNIDNGAVLMIVSTPFQRAAEIRKIVKNLHLKN